jgi:hypothetical protein
MLISMWKNCIEEKYVWFSSMCLDPRSQRT